MKVAKLPCGRCALVSAPNSALPDVASRLPDFSGRPSLVAVHYSICNILVQAPSLASMLSFTPLTGSGNLRPLLLRSHCAAKISRGISRPPLYACVSCVRDCRACCACPTSSQVVLTAAQCIMSVLKYSKPPGYNGALWKQLWRNNVSNSTGTWNKFDCHCFVSSFNTACQSVSPSVSQSVGSSAEFFSRYDKRAEDSICWKLRLGRLVQRSAAKFWWLCRCG